MKKKNVLHLVEYLYLGGIERLLEQFSIQSRGNVNSFFMTYETLELKGIGKQIKSNGFPVFTYKKKLGRDWKFLFHLINIAWKNKIEVVHTHDFGPVEYALLLKIFCPWIKLVHTQHTIVHFVRNPRYTFFFQFASYFYSSVICVSKFVKSEIIHHCPYVRKNNLKIIPNGVDVQVFRREGKLPIVFFEKKIKMVSIARISKEKNLNYLLETCRMLKAEFIPFEFHHAGTSKNDLDLKLIEKYLVEHDLTQNVFFHGFVDDAKKILDLGDVFLSASFTEGHPVAVLEAMACELVCYCSDILAHREISPGSINLFDVTNPTSLFELLKIRSTLNKFEEEAAQIARARQEVLEKFSIEKMVVNYVDQYE